MSELDNKAERSHDKLNWRQLKFVSEFCLHGNALQAAKAAGYSHPKQQGSRLLTHVDVMAAIEAHKRQMMARTVDKTDWLIERLTEESLDTENNESARIRALEILGKIYGSFAPEKSQVETISSGFFADLEEETEVEEVSSNVFAIKSKA